MALTPVSILSPSLQSGQTTGETQPQNEETDPQTETDNTTQTTTETEAGSETQSDANTANTGGQQTSAPLPAPSASQSGAVLESSLSAQSIVPEAPSDSEIARLNAAARDQASAARDGFISAQALEGLQANEEAADEQTSLVKPITEDSQLAGRAAAGFSEGAALSGPLDSPDYNLRA